MTERVKARTEQVFSEEKWIKVNRDNKMLLDDFLTELKSTKKSHGTIKQYRADLRMIFCHLLEDFNNKSILELTKKDFRRINLWLIDRGVSNARANRVMSAIRSMLTYAEEDDETDYDNNLAGKVKGLPKEPVREIVFLSDERISILREKLREMEEYQLMALLDMAYDSAGRRNELFQVQKYGLLEKNITNMVVGKRGKKFKLIYFDRTKESLTLYLNQRGDDDLDALWICGTGDNKKPASYGVLYDWFVKMADILADIEGKYTPFNAHSFRHCALDNMSTGDHYICKKLGKADGFNIDELKLHAHHSDIGTTSSYLKDRDDEILSGMFGIDLEE